MDISESVRLFCEDCMQGMKRIPDESIDMVLCDLPYGVLNRSNKSAGWDEVIPPDLLWKEYTRIVKSNGAIVLFAQGMFTAQLMMSNVKMWRYNLIWQKGGDAPDFSMPSVCRFASMKIFVCSIAASLSIIRR